MSDPRLTGDKLRHISHDTLAAYSVGSGTVNSSVSMKPLSQAQALDNHKNSAYIGLEALFTPVSIVVQNRTGNGDLDIPSTGTIPVMPIRESGTVNSTKLNPYIGGNIRTFLNHVEMAVSGEDGTVDVVNTMAFRSPMILAGWGQDTAGKIVPSGDNPKLDQSKWKVGPLATKWNERKGVWMGGDEINLVRMISNSEKIFDVYDISTGQHIDSGVTRQKVLGIEYTQLCSGEIVIAYDMLDKIDKYAAVTRPLRGVRVITDFVCANGAIFAQYAYIATPYVSAAELLDKDENGKIITKPAPDPCDTLNMQPWMIGVPFYP